MNGMTCTDIVAILEACGKSGALSISVGDLTATFSGGEQPHVDSIIPMPYTIDTTAQPDAPAEEEEDEVDVDELMFTDPEAWDEYARNGE